MIGSNTRNYKQDAGENLYRRSMYTFWKRSAPPASMDIFNAPSREVCTVRRERTNTPLQALVTLNDPQFVEAARIWRSGACSKGATMPTRGSSSSLVGCSAGRCEPKRARPCEATLNDLLAYYQSHADDAKQLLAVGESPVDASLDVPTLAAWTMVCNELMNLDEVLNK